MDKVSKEKNNILMSDSNPNVRKLLLREFLAEGYEVTLAKDGNEVIKWLNNINKFDLLILDSELLDSRGIFILKELRESHPDLPVIFHAFSDNNQQLVLEGTLFIEKGGNSIEHLKYAVKEMLNKKKQS